MNRPGQNDFTVLSPNRTSALIGRVAFVLCCFIATHSRAAETPPPVILEARGTVELSKGGANVWTLVKAGQPLVTGDRIRTGENSGAIVRLADLSIWQMPEISVIGIEAPRQPQSKLDLFVERGLGFF